MKKFIIINGKDARVVEREDMDAARTTAINTCNHSLEIIVREINNIEL